MIAALFFFLSDNEPIHPEGNYPETHPLRLAAVYHDSQGDAIILSSYRLTLSTVIFNPYPIALSYK